ncbi:MAG: acyl-CoA thioesterase [Hyphomicrobiales bacterium]|nr:acyl-CoA thioesterase [Hyphomicrobiales bacterium]
MLINRRTVRIEWADCDAAGIVFYPNYFSMFDSSTHHLFEAAGWKKRDLIREFDIVGYPMVDTGAKFMVPSTFGDDVVIETQVSEFGRSSFKIAHRLLKPGPDGAEIVAIEAWEARVWVGRHPDDPTRMKSRPIPEEVIRRLSAA